MSPSLVRVEEVSPAGSRGRSHSRDGTNEPTMPARCINPASEINSRLDVQVEVRVYPCNNNQGAGKKKCNTFTIKPEVSHCVLYPPLQFQSVFWCSKECLFACSSLL